MLSIIYLLYKLFNHLMGVIALSETLQQRSETHYFQWLALQQGGFSLR